MYTKAFLLYLIKFEREHKKIKEKEKLENIKEMEALNMK